MTSPIIARLSAALPAPVLHNTRSMPGGTLRATNARRGPENSAHRRDEDRGGRVAGLDVQAHTPGVMLLSA